MQARSRILVVEDESIVALGIQNKLESLGYDVPAIVSSGEEAIRKAGETTPDLVLMDIMLEGDMDGIVAAEQIKQRYDLPVVFLTAYSDNSTLERAKVSEPFGYLIKPFEERELKSTIEMAIYKHKVDMKLKELLLEVEKNRGDMLSILDELRVGTAMTNGDGHITFLSKMGEKLFGKNRDKTLGRHWQEAFSLDTEHKTRLKFLLGCAPGERTKISAQTETPSGHRYWVEIEVKDDPRDMERKIFFFYDVTEVQDLRRLLDEKSQFQGLLGKSKPMQLVYDHIREVAKVDSTVLIEGATGTGKELVAQAIHFSSVRKDKPFIPVNSAGLTESLLNSQLFGHKKGAFTGAISDQQGLFEAANGGTIFLDEIGDIPMNVQVNLLRVLEQREITPIGESKPRKIDVRVIAATHRNIAEEVEKGNFRSDLLYRIRVARIQLPSLYDHREDVPLLVGAFLGLSRAATGKAVEDVSSEAIGALMKYDWPGNVRELKNAVEFAVIRSKGSILQSEDLPPEISDYLSKSHSEDGFKDERERLLDALDRARGNRTLAARLLGIGRTTLYRRLIELGIKAEE